MWKGLESHARSEPPLNVSRQMQQKKFSVFRGKSERMPTQMRSHIETTMRAPAGTGLSNTQLSRTTAGDFWLANVGSATCLAQAGLGGVTCDTAASVAARGLSLGVFTAVKPGTGRPRDFLVLGVAPDWARTARVKVKSTVRQVPIRMNAFGLRAKAPITIERFER